MFTLVNWYFLMCMSHQCLTCWAQVRKGDPWISRRWVGEPFDSIIPLSLLIPFTQNPFNFIKLWLFWHRGVSVVHLRYILCSWGCRRINLYLLVILISHTTGRKRVRSIHLRTRRQSSGRCMGLGWWQGWGRGWGRRRGWGWGLGISDLPSLLVSLQSIYMNQIGNRLLLGTTLACSWWRGFGVMEEDPG